MRKVETWLRTASALLLIVHNQLGNFNFFQQTSVISEEVEIHLQIPVSLLAALMLSIGGVHQKSHDTRDGPWYENPAPCQYLNRKSVVGNLKQQVFPLRGKKKTSPLTKRYCLLKRPQHFVLSRCLIARIWRDSLFPWLHPKLNYFSKKRRLLLISQTQDFKSTNGDFSKGNHFGA